MKISFVSSQAISHAMRYQMQRMQVDLMNAQQEVVTGRHADVGLALGARAGYSFSLTRESERLESLIDSNQLAQSRLSATQANLQQIRSEAEEFLTGLNTAISGAGDPHIIRQQAEALLDQITGALNSNINGEHIFAGINTDARPMADFSDPASPNRVAFEAAFAAHFADPSTATAAQMDDFLDNVVAGQFLGADWNTYWSSATDQQIVSRITLSETAQTSVSANIPGIRKLVMAAVAVTASVDKEMSAEARAAALDKAFSLVGDAINDLVNQQAETGITEQRLENANERLTMQKDLFTATAGKIEGVDPYEASTRVTSLLSQIEISYALTSRMQNMSLLRYLG